MIVSLIKNLLKLFCITSCPEAGIFSLKQIKKNQEKKKKKICPGSSYSAANNTGQKTMKIDKVYKENHKTDHTFLFIEN